VSILPIGTTKVKKIKSSNGATNKNALILFFLSDFFRLSFRGIPSVVKISDLIFSLIKYFKIKKRRDQHLAFFNKLKI
jgi:hypothetical protein